MGLLFSSPAPVLCFQCRGGVMREYRAPRGPGLFQSMLKCACSFERPADSFEAAVQKHAGLPTNPYIPPGFSV